MYGYPGKHFRVAVPIASAASYTSAVNIRGANKVGLEIGAVGTLLGANTVSLRVDVCDTETGTFNPLHAETVASAASGVTLWETLQGSGGIVANCEPVVGYNYMRVHLSTAATDGISSTYVHVVY